MSHHIHFDTEQIRKDSKNIFNRLKSIAEDADFVSELAALFPKLVVVANERCGTWYIDPKLRHPQTVYFKSTDGHMGKWDFNLRRHNLHLINDIANHGGCIIVDSTRRGKRIPDSLSKTVAIWCCTINNAIRRFRQQQEKAQDELERRVVNGIDNETSKNYVEDEPPLADDNTWDLAFHSLPSVISRSEHNQIERLIPDFVAKLMVCIPRLTISPSRKQSSNIDLAHLSSVLAKPLRPIWFTPQSFLFLNDLPDYSQMPFWPVVCLSASAAVQAGMEWRQGYLYVQGSADDHEMWSMGLTPTLFWQHRGELLMADAAACEKVVRCVVREANFIDQEDNFSVTAYQQKSYDFIGNTNIAIGSRRSGKPPQCWNNFDVIINCTELEYEGNRDERHAGRYLQLAIPEGKKGQHVLARMIPRALEFVEGPLREGRRVLVHCAKGQDRSVGIALAIFVKYFDDHELKRLHEDFRTIRRCAVGSRQRP
ncbi:tRNA A64-2'-O-ribosylphosphate transferase [Jimgerdemannia flammicorona]|uniref:tRNA A64-2'-O-ribosylphosphate transferase n=1 Tax=Jimgerdemannia flammicorona TaxID=994334 RepID=A0A433D4L1_9FUNG|nr:tRNA A64-2'-O-ribosylphosphate transferase [Jimgerdemannia flammicorona]